MWNVCRGSWRCGCGSIAEALAEAVNNFLSTTKEKKTKLIWNLVYLPIRFTIKINQTNVGFLYRKRPMGIPNGYFSPTNPPEIDVTVDRAQIMSSFGFLLAPTTTSLCHIFELLHRALDMFRVIRGWKLVQMIWQMFWILFGLPQIFWFAHVWNETCKTCFCNKETVNKILRYYVYIDMKVLLS